MYKLRATILKDIRILLRDKVGLIFMFGMPIILAVVITALQNSTFELVNDNKVPLLLCNRDTGEAGKQLVAAIEKVGLFNMKQVIGNKTEKEISDRMHAKDALIAIIIPENFSFDMSVKAQNISGKALNELGLETDTINSNKESIESHFVMRLL